MISPEELIELFNLQKAKIVGRNLMASCPNAVNHSKGTDKHRSFGINLDTYEYNCYSCKLKGDNISSLARKLKVGLSNDLMFRSVRVASKERKTMEKKFYDISLIEKHLENSQEAYDFYLKSRGISLAAIQRFKVGFNKNTNSVIFPCFDYQQRLLGWIERNESWENRYAYKPDGVLREHLIFAMDRTNIKTAFIVEGVIDALRLISWGLEGVALNGNILFTQQAREIIQHCEAVCIIPDNDEPGKKLCIDVEKEFKGKIPVYICLLPEGIKDIGDQHLSRQQFLEYYKDNVTFLF
jgi:DNA primase